jgi:hypothetical protein
MKLDKLVTVVTLIRFALPVLWFVVESGPKGQHCHGEFDERRLQFLLVVHKILVFRLRTVISVIEGEFRGALNM